MPTTFTPNECAPAWVKGEGAVDFVLTTLSPPPGKDEDHGYIRLPAANHNPR